MVRPSKSAKVLTECSQTKEEINDRINQEEKLKGKADKIDPPDYLTKNQKDLFYYIKSELEASEILGNLDVYILAKCAIAIDRLQFIEEIINKNPSSVFKNQIMSSKDKYDKDFYRCINELSLSPQSRAKISNINNNVNGDKADPVIQVVRGN